MKLKSVHIRDFKRFTDLKVVDIPETAKLVVLMGPNGSGKSSLFEAFNYWISPSRGVTFQKDYHWKVGANCSDNWHELHSRINIEFYNETINPQERNEKTQKAFYFRTAYRHEADFATQQLGGIGNILDDPRRPPILIATESRVSDNYQRLVSATFEELYNTNNDNIRVLEVRERLIGKVRAAMQHVFDDLLLTSPGKPLVDGTFFFEKGMSRNYRYKNLSGGEKAAFDLLLDFIIKSESFNDTIFCIDEPELHMHTKLQSRLLSELFNLLPHNCQLWIATHSIGMTRRAMEIYRSNPGEVVFLDFEGHNFDSSAVIRPVQVDRYFWKRIFSVALDDLAELIAPSQLVFCEGRPEDGGKHRNTTFDAEIYRRVFSKTYPETDFIPLGGTNELERNSITISNIFQRLFSNMEIWSVIDRDDRSMDEIIKCNEQGIQVLYRRDLESYLWDNEIIRKLCISLGQEDKIPDLLSRKEQLINESVDRGNPKDDIKSISGPLYVETKKILGLTQCGNTSAEFCKTILSPLITPDTDTYKELGQAVFGKRFKG